MPLNPHDKSEAVKGLELLLNENEAEALIATLHGIANKRANDDTVDDNARNRWRHSAAALQTVLGELVKANEPQRHKAEHKDSEAYLSVSETTPDTQAAAEA